MSTDVLVTRETYAIFRLRALYAVYWREAPTIEAMTTLRTTTSGSAPYVLVNYIFGGTPRFENDVREALKRSSKRPGAREGLAHVVTMTGLAGAATRAFVSASSIWDSHSRVFSSASEAAPWLVERLAACGETWTVEEITRAVTRREDQVFTTASARDRKSVLGSR